MKNLVLKIFFQLVLEPLPVSSSAQLEIISFFLDNQILQKSEKKIIQLFNVLSDLIVFLYIFLHSKKIERKINYFVFLKFFRLFFFAGLANILTMIIFFQQQKIIAVLEIPLFLKLYINFIISFFVISSNFLKEYWQKIFPQKEAFPSLTTSLILGFVQGLSTLQGISRLGITFVVARWLNFSPKTALFFSWLMHFQISFLYLFKYFKEIKSISFIYLFSTLEYFFILAGLLISYYVFKLTYTMALQKKFYLFAIVQFGMVLCLTVYFLWR